MDTLILLSNPVFTVSDVARQNSTGKSEKREKNVHG